MPKRTRSFTTRRRFTKRARMYKRPTRTGRFRSYRSRLDHRVNVHSFARWVATPQETTVENPNTSKANVAFFQLNDLGSVSEFTTLYDRYKITKVQARFQLVTNPDGPLYTNSSGTWNPTNWFPKLWYVKDYDDSIVESLSSLKERALVRCIVMQPNKLYKVNVRPATLVQAYATASTTGSVPRWNQWIDMGAPDVKHYGLKYSVDADGIAPTANYPFKVRVEFKYWFTCKDVR